MTLQDALIVSGAASWLLLLGVLGPALGVVIVNGARALGRRIRGGRGE